MRLPHLPNGAILNGGVDVELIELEREPVLRADVARGGQIGRG